MTVAATTNEAAVRLDKTSHIYWLGNRRFESVGGLVKRITPVFNADFHAERVAKNRGITKAQVLKEWAQKRDAACDTGHQLHEFIDRTLAGQHPEEREQGEQLPQKCLRWLEWWQVAGKSLTPVKTEAIVHSERLGYAGTLDLLAKSSKTNNLCTVDWKQSGRFDKDNRYREYLLHPFQDLPNCEWTRYSLQISLYLLAVEEELGQEIGESWILHVTDDDATPFMAMDLRRRAAAWVEGLKL